jgi:hypothetical protein
MTTHDHIVFIVANDARIREALSAHSAAPALGDP